MGILIIYFIIMMVVTVLFTKKSETVEDLLVSDRNISLIPSALSIAATWIWAPALLVSAEKAYTWGIPGLFWFLVPNALCLVIFSPYAEKIRHKMPYGYTLSGYMKSIYGDRVKKLYLTQLLIITILSTVVQLLAGGLLVSSIAGVPFTVTTIALSVIAYSYSQFSGIKASVITDALQMIIMLVVCFVLAPMSIKAGGGLNAVKIGMSGITGEYGSLFSLKGKEVFLAFGLSTSIGLISGPFGDQSFWQRAFSTKKSEVKKSFILGAIFFAIVPLSMGIIGFVSAGVGMKPMNVGMVNVEFIQNYLPSIMFYPFVFMIISGLMSTVDSNLCSITSLINDIKSGYSLRDSKWTMVILLIVSVLGANIPGLTVTKLFMIYGQVRASTLFTTILTLNDVKLNSSGVAMGIIASLVVGLPIFVYGTLNGISSLIVLGSLITSLMSGTVALIYTKLRVGNYARKKEIDKKQ